MIQNFRTYTLAKEFYQQARNLKLTAPLNDQFQRAILSIVLNIAEGGNNELNNLELLCAAHHKIVHQLMGA